MAADSPSMIPVLSRVWRTLLGHVGAWWTSRHDDPAGAGRDPAGHPFALGPVCWPDARATCESTLESPAIVRGAARSTTALAALANEDWTPHPDLLRIGIRQAMLGQIDPSSAVAKTLFQAAMQPNRPPLRSGLAAACVLLASPRLPLDWYAGLAVNWMPQLAPAIVAHPMSPGLAFWCARIAQEADQGDPSFLSPRAGTDALTAAMSAYPEALTIPVFRVHLVTSAMRSGWSDLEHLHTIACAAVRMAIPTRRDEMLRAIAVAEPERALGVLDALTDAELATLSAAALRPLLNHAEPHIRLAVLPYLAKVGAPPASATSATASAREGRTRRGLGA